MAMRSPVPGPDAHLQAGGGTAAGLDKAATEVCQFSEPVMSYLKTMYNDLQQSYTKTGAGMERFFIKEQRLNPGIFGAHEAFSFEEFLEYFRSGHSNALEPAEEQDLTRPLSNYFISSSHNTYLTGHQLYGSASTDGYRNVLIRGCKSLEIDVWDGEDSSDEEDETASGKEKRSLRERLGFGKRNKSGETPPVASASNDSAKLPLEKPKPWKLSGRVEPRVLHGYTLTRDIPFRKVCEAIGKYAFVTSDLPLIVSLEVHTSHEQQEMMVEIMHECWDGMLIDMPEPPAIGPSSETIPLPCPQDLRRRILIKVKYTPPKPPTAEPDEAALALARTKSAASDKSSSSSEEDEAQGQKPTKRAGKIIEALSRLGVYTRSYHFKSFDQPEANIPTHVFSLSESALMEIHQQDSTSLFRHNKDYLMRAYPKGLRVSSSNLDPAIFWRQGVQMVALNWQRWDAGMMLNEGMFAGYGGWVLKPEGYRSGSASERQKTASNRITLDLTIEFFAGQDIPLPEGKEAKELRPYVKCELHVEKREERTAENIPGGGMSRDGEHKQKTATAKGQYPDFKREKMSFLRIPDVVADLSFVRFKVMHNDRFGNDDLAAWACFRLDRLQPGFRFVHLFDAAGAQSKGVLFVRVEKALVSSPA